MTAAAPVQVDIRKVAAMVATARRLLGTGTMLDLSALQGTVAALCAAVAALPGDDARPLRPGLEALLAELDRLAEDLHAHHRRLGGHVSEGGG